MRELAIHFTRFVWRALQEDWQKWDHLVISNWVPLGKYPTFGDLKSTLLQSVDTVRELICSLDTVNDRVAPMFGFITQLYLICCNYHTFSFEKQAYKEKFKRPNFRSEREQCTVGNV